MKLFHVISAQWQIYGKDRAFYLSFRVQRRGRLTQQGILFHQDFSPVISNILRRV